MKKLAARITGLAILLILCLALLGRAFHLIAPSVTAQIPSGSNLQGEGVLAPATPIQPTSVSVINFAELAAKEAKASKEINPDAAPVLRAVHPPRTISEGDSAIADRPVSATPQGNEIHPLVSSPAPSQSFLAQEDGPEVGTGTFDIPPDTMGAVGPDKLFVNVNNNYRVQDKTTGAALSTVSINTFWSSTGTSGVFDPRVQYDPYNNRWIVAATSNGDTSSSSILVGISATSDPQGTFTLFRFTVGCAAGSANCDAGGETADFPMLGFNKNWVAIAWNQFQISGGSFVSGKMLAIDYPTLRTGAVTSTVFTVTPAANAAAFCMHPATTLSATEDALYVPAHISSASATYRLHKLTGTPSAPAYVLDAVSKTRTGGAWNQPGGDSLPQTCIGLVGVACPSSPRFIDSGDAFIRSNVVFRNGNIWYTQTVMVTTFLAHAAAQWTRIDDGGNFVDGGRVEDPNASFSNGGEFYAYPSIAVNSNNDVLLGFSNFSSAHFARAGYALRLGTDAAGTMRDPVIFKEGEDYYSKDFGGSRNRWGDYSHTVVDPANDQDMWTIQEYAGTRVVQDGQQTTNNSRWGTWWAKVPPTGAAPSPTPTPSPIPCTTFTLNDAGDAGDAAPGDATCATAGGVCTLRAAIQEANTLLACGTIAINASGVTGPITLSTALPDINRDISINGPGANQLTVQRNTAAGTPDFRIFLINQGKSMSVSGLTISNGRVNSTADGGGVRNNGKLTMTRCNVYGNSSIGSPGNGGGIVNVGSLTLTDCNVGGTSAGQGNTATSGAGIETLGTLVMTGGSVSGNSGGGINQAQGSMTLKGVAITSNTAQGGGGLVIGAGATIADCLIANNSATVAGGGIDMSSTQTTVTNTTISGNTSDGSGGGIALNNSGRINLTNVTITNNRSDMNSSGNEKGGGIDHQSSGAVTLNNTIVGGNFRGGGNSTTADDVNGPLAASSAFNVIGDCNGCALTDAVNNNQIGWSSPGLGPLANNGGPTMTHAILPFSPAIDRGSNTLAKDQNNNPLTTDQRGAGFNRIINTIVDVGAFEAQTSLPTPTPTPIPTPTPTPTPLPTPTPGDPPPTIAINDIAVAESDAGLHTVFFRASLSKPWAQEISFQFDPTPGTATSFVDYRSLGGDVATIPPGQTFTGLGVQIVGDTIDEFDETFFMNLSHPTNGATFSRAQGTCTILDDDPPPTISINDVSITEGNSGTTNAVFTVSLSAASGKPISVDFATANGIATAGSDYVATSGTISFDPGETTKTIPVTVNGDTTIEPDETFFVNLTNPVNVTMSRSHGTGTIVSDDSVRTIQFSAPSYSVTEDGQRVNIVVVRSGDTTSSASVNFATNDAAGLTNCNVFNGTASPRCDYENTIGTATWAAGDATSKSFSIAIVNDSYAEGTESFTIGLNSPSGATLGAQSTATVTITDNEASNGPNPIDNTDFFVRQQYLDFLGREPDPPGFAGWTSTINNCSGDTTQCDRIHVSQLFFQSAEFQERGYFVYRFYPVAFGRKPDYAEFVPDLASVSGFLDANQLEAAKVQFIANFMARSAFASMYNSLNSTQYVDTLLNTAGVTLSSRQAMIDGLNNSTMTRAQVLRQIVESTEVATKYNHQAYAVMEYFGYLRRQPDAFYLAWIAVLDQSNDPRGMVTGFVTSTEYRNRFGP